MTGRRRAGTAVLRGLAAAGTVLAWVGLPLALAGPVMVILGGDALNKTYGCRDALCERQSVEDSVALGAVLLLVGTFATLAGAMAFIPWVRDRTALAALRRLWRPRQETWKSLYAAGHLGEPDHRALMAASEPLLARRQPAWLARYAARVARGVGIGLVAAGCVGIGAASLPTDVTDHCQTSSCRSILLAMGTVGGVVLLAGIPFLVLGVTAGTVARRQLRQAIAGLEAAEAAALASAHARRRPRAAR